MGTLLAIGGAYALASYDWCRTDRGEVISGAGFAVKGPLRVGAGKAELPVFLPATLAGYGPLRPRAERVASPLLARALVFKANGRSVGLLTLDALYVPASLVERIRASVAPLGLDAVWVAATHSHSSVAGFDPGILGRLVVGTYREEIAQGMSDAAAKALAQAHERLVEVSIEVAAFELNDTVLARSGPTADARLNRLRFVAGAGPVGELVVLAGHPTTVPRDSRTLEPDFPGELSALLEEAGGVAVVLQGAMGNATVRAEPQGGAKAYAAVLAEKIRAGGLSTWNEEGRLAHGAASVALPRPDASRLVPRLFRAAGDNLVCWGAPKRVEVSVLTVGPLSLLALPGEPSYGAGRLLEEAADVGRVVALANGYFGYVEPASFVEVYDGEAQRQYFGPGLLGALEEGARAAAAVARGPK